MTEPTEEPYREALHRCLDERRDPLDQPEIVAFLEAHPEHLDEFARLRASLTHLAQAAPSQPQQPTAMAGPRRRIGRRGLERVSAALVAAAAGITLWFVLANPHADEAPQTDQTPHAANPAAAGDSGPRLRPPRILSASLQEQAPMLRAAARYTVHESLVRTDTTLLEAYEHRSQAR